MKELTIEEKAKRYDEAIKIAKSKIRYDKDHVLCERDVIEIFPELKESEDEIIKKALLEMVNDTKGDDLWINYNVHKEDAAAWLKKQGEHKSIWHDDSDEPIRGSLILLIMQSGTPVVAKIIEPNHTFNHGERWAYIDDLLKKQDKQNSTDKVEPKFKVGDFIVNDYCRGYVVALTNDAYLLDTGQGIPFSCEHNIHLWTIKDAKDGDVLATKNNRICIFNNTVEEGKYPFAYCGLSIYGFEVYDRILPFTRLDVYPATKEQRDKLEKAMLKAGYKWDSDKKELIKL